MEYTVNVTDTWEQKTVVFPASPSAGTWDYTNGAGVYVRFPLIAGSNSHATPGSWGVGNLFSTSSAVNDLDNTANFFRITGVKLELGSVATPIQYRSFNEELALCQRYYEKSFLYATTPAQNIGTNTGEFTASAAAAGAVNNTFYITYKVTKRILASGVTFYNPSVANGQVRNVTGGADFTATAGVNFTDTGTAITATGTAGTAAGNRVGVHWTVEADL
jgi:hypothetical protein